MIAQEEIIAPANTMIELLKNAVLVMQVATNAMGNLSFKSIFY